MEWHSVWQRPSEAHPWASAGWLWSNPGASEVGSANCGLLRAVSMRPGSQGWCVVGNGSEPYEKIQPRTSFPVGAQRWYQVWRSPQVWDQFGRRRPFAFAGWLWTDARGASAVRETIERADPGSVMVT